MCFLALLLTALSSHSDCAERKGAAGLMPNSSKLTRMQVLSILSTLEAKVAVRRRCEPGASGGRREADRGR